jgi:hypothetical protein
MTSMSMAGSHKEASAALSAHVNISTLETSSSRQRRIRGWYMQGVSAPRYFLVNEFCGNASFFETAWSNSSFTLEVAFNRVYDLVATCIFMHKPLSTSLNIMHHSLKVLKGTQAIKRHINGVQFALQGHSLCGQSRLSDTCSFHVECIKS